MGEEKTEYSLASSKGSLGELVPVLKDKFGNIIDGFHRKGENAEWREETLPWIDTPEKLEAARLAVNFNRRKMAPEEIKERIVFLLKKGMKVEDIEKLTGISQRTIYRYMPQDMKNQTFVELGQSKAAVTDGNESEVSRDEEQTVTIQDSPPTPAPKATPLSTIKTASQTQERVQCSSCHVWTLFPKTREDGKVVCSLCYALKQKPEPQTKATPANAPAPEPLKVPNEATGNAAETEEEEPRMFAVTCPICNETIHLTHYAAGDHDINLHPTQAEAP